MTHGALLAPKGMFKTNDENPMEIELDDEFKYPDLAELNNLENWAFQNAHILQCGRVNYP